MDSVNKVFHSMNILGGDIWDRITDGSPDNLNELGIHTAVVVISCFHKSLVFLVVPTHLLTWFFFLSFIQNIMSQVRHHVIMAQNERILKEEVLRLQLSLDEAKDLVAAKAENRAQES